MKVPPVTARAGTRQLPGQAEVSPAGFSKGSGLTPSFLRNLTSELPLPGFLMTLF